MNGLPSTMPTTPLLLSSLFDRGAHIQPQNLIIEKIEGGYSSQTYHDHLISSKALALALTENSSSSPRVQRGDRIATFSFNTNRHFTCYHAVPLMGCVLHPINIRLGPKEIGYILGHAQDVVVIVDAVLLESFAKVSKEDLVEEEINFVVQVNGKKRSVIKVKRDIIEKDVLEKIKLNQEIKNFIKNQEIKKTIFVPNRLVNIII